jgi:NAD(P)-dependent dehydrogenase (short-subunit alcohol dehydrogenase family)
MFSFEGQVAWVTGSSTGIGRATALAFAQSEIGLSEAALIIGPCVPESR